MAKETFVLHSVTPESYKISSIVNELRRGSLALYPTDTGMALGCALSNKKAIERIRTLRGLPPRKPLTFLCDGLSDIARYASVSDAAFRLMKRLVPGPYTFILPASREVPSFVCNEKRKTTGIRVPDSIVGNAILRACGEPIISISASRHPDDATDGEPELTDDILEYYSSKVDIVIELDSYNFCGESTVVDLTGDSFEIIREGAGMKELLQWMQ